MDDHCYTCNGVGLAREGWSGNPSGNGVTCPDCAGTGVDKTPYGTGGDHCAQCGTDWKQPHDVGCVAAR